MPSTTSTSSSDTSSDTSSGASGDRNYLCPLLLNQIIDNRYCIVSLLSSSEYGVVWQALDEWQNRHVFLSLFRHLVCLRRRLQ
jgi:hypothetical protein